MNRLNILLVGLVLAGCQSTYPKVHPELGINHTIPGETIANARPVINNVIIQPAQGKRMDVKHQIDSDTFNKHIASILSSRGVNVVRRSYSQALINESQFSEFNDKGEYTGFKATDYYIETSVKASIVSMYKQPEPYVDDKGVSHPFDPYCEFKLYLNAEIELLQTAKREMVKHFPLKQEISKAYRNPVNRQCPVSAGEHDILINEAIYRYIAQGKSGDDFLSYLVPEFVVLDAYKLDGDVFYRTNMGKQYGVAEGQKVLLFNRAESGRLLFIGFGEFISPIYADSKNSYITIDGEAEKYIRKGTILRLGSDKCSIFDVPCYLREIGIETGL